jgi:CRISPR/Cas system-associated exonuclease Cas4 (RecB family)
VPNYSVRSRNLFNPRSKEPFKLSRSKIDLFLNCARCFYFDRKKGVGRPDGFPFNLNKAVDTLLKKEFDIHRAKKTAHPLMKAYGIDAVPLAHREMDTWRENFKGIQYYHEPTNFLITGAIDDVWVSPDGELIIVDYKATSKNGEVTLDAEWQIGYKRQMEIYQWLFRQNGFPVSDTGYFVYCNGNTDTPSFDGKLEFDVKVIPYEGHDTWIEKTLGEIRKTLERDKIPESDSTCDYCAYRRAAGRIE